MHFETLGVGRGLMVLGSGVHAWVQIIQYRPQKTIVLIMGTPRKVPLILGNLQMGSGSLGSGLRIFQVQESTMAPIKLVLCVKACFMRQGAFQMIS